MDNVRPFTKTYTADVWCDNCKQIQKVSVPWGELVSSYDKACVHCGCTREQILKEQERQMMQSTLGPHNAYGLMPGTKTK